MLLPMKNIFAISVTFWNSGIGDPPLSKKKVPKLYVFAKFFQHFHILAYCIRTLPREGMYWEIHPRGPIDLPKTGILHPEAREIA